MKVFLLAIFFSSLVALDLGTKYLVQENITLATPSLSIFSDILSLKLSYNTGVAFSFPIEGILLKVVTVLLVLGLIYYFFKEEYKKDSRILDTAYILILAGAFSHTYERIFVGHVVDFIAVKYFAILNFADIFISTGVCLLIIYYIRYEYARKH